jgi:predicted P-type ATPase
MDSSLVSGTAIRFLLSSDILLFLSLTIAIYVVASALPPLLPTVFIVSEGISAERLLQKRIAVTDPHRILMAGKVRVAFFDKTGTLTEQGLDYHSVITVSGDANFITSTHPHESIIDGMSVCHSLKKINQNSDPVLLGNAIDRKMFEATGSDLIGGMGVNPDIVVTAAGTRFSILRQFDFDNKLKTQSVIVRDESSGKVFVFVKGTGEAIKSISVASSIPATFDDRVASSAKFGFYQIAMGYRIVDNEKEILSKTRGEVEASLTFIGFLNFTNRMKPQTPAMLKELRQGNIRTVMISGDHVLTAIFMARESGMVHKGSVLLLGRSISDSGVIEWVEESSNELVPAPSLEELRAHDSNIELAMVGHVWDALWEMDKARAKDLAYHIRVIGRCSPHTKITIIECFNREGFITLMCGDGGNDCGALKTAHVGIALSDAEASVVSSFTSLDKTITSVVEVLKEGRCTLASAFSSYKFMIMYGQIETINQMVCAYFGVTFSEWCWVFMDGFWVITLAFSLPFADVADTLAPFRPTSSILGPQTLCSVLGVLLINFLFLVLAIGIMDEQDFYQCRKWDDASSIADVTALGDNYESSVVFLVSGYQYITSAIAFSFGFKFRAPMYKNWRFLFFVMCWTVIHFTVILYPSSLSCFFRVNCTNDDVIRGATVDTLVPIQNPWHHTLMPLQFREVILVIVIMNGVALVLWEYFVVNGFVADFIRKTFPKEEKLLGGIGYNGASRIGKSQRMQSSRQMLALEVVYGEPTTDGLV